MTYDNICRPAETCALAIYSCGTAQVIGAPIVIGAILYAIACRVIQAWYVAKAVSLEEGFNKEVDEKAKKFGDYAFKARQTAFFFLVAMFPLFGGIMARSCLENKSCVCISKQNENFHLC